MRLCAEWLSKEFANNVIAGSFLARSRPASAPGLVPAGLKMTLYEIDVRGKLPR
jgi:hypothetical protein